MSDLVTWLHAQIEEQKSSAFAAWSGPWMPDPDGYVVVDDEGQHVADGFSLSNRQLRATVVHIALNNPVNVIARCDAELAILGLHHERAGSCDHCGGLPGYETDSEWPCQTLALLASGYQHLLGFKEHWRP